VCVVIRWLEVRFHNKNLKLVFLCSLLLLLSYEYVLGYLFVGTRTLSHALRSPPQAIGNSALSAVVVLGFGFDLECETLLIRVCFFFLPNIKTLSSRNTLVENVSHPQNGERICCVECKEFGFWDVNLFRVSVSVGAMIPMVCCCWLEKRLLFGDGFVGVKEWSGERNTGTSLLPRCLCNALLISVFCYSLQHFFVASSSFCFLILFTFVSK